MNIRRPIDVKRKKDKRDSKKKIVLIGSGIALIVVVVGIVIGIKQAPALRVREMSVVGVPEAYGAQVKQLLGDFSRERSSLFRFLGSDNMVAWDSAPKEFLAEHPEFTSIRLEKDYVNRSIVVEVDSREKFGVWCRVPNAREVSNGVVDDEVDIATSTDSMFGSGDEECFWFDRNGVLFARAPKVQSELFNRVRDLTGRSLALRDTILPDRLFGNLVRVFRLMEIAQINTKTVSLRDIALEEVEADSITDPVAVFSLRFDPSFALSAINELKKNGTWRELRYANFTVENRVSYK